MYLALGIVIVVYVLVSALIVMTLTLPAMEANGGHVLSEAGQHILGRVGFVIAVAPVAYSSPLPSPPHSCCSSRLPPVGQMASLARSSSSTARSASVTYVCIARLAQSLGHWCSR